MKLARFYGAKPSLFNENWNNFLNDNWSSFFSDENFKPVFGTSPAVNISEDENGYSLELAAPGLKKEDFKIDLDKDVLTISVNHEEEKAEDKKGYTRREFRYGSFKRSFVLPEVVDVEAIKGSYDNGILTVQLPKKAEVKPAKKTIEIA